MCHALRLARTERIPSICRERHIFTRLCMNVQRVACWLRAPAYPFVDTHGKERPHRPPLRSAASSGTPMELSIAVPSFANWSRARFDLPPVNL